MLYLRSMNETEHQQFLDYVISNYAEEKVLVGNYAPVDAMELATIEYQELLPDGVKTKENFLFIIVDNVLRRPLVLSGS